MSCRLLREGASLLSESLTYIFNLSIVTCQFPQQWKIATVIPLFKQRGDRQSPSNYRPVSLLPAVGKIMDQLQSEALLSHLVNNKLISAWSAHQFGFFPNRYTTMQLVYILETWLHSLEDGKGTVAIFMDFYKAFDRVWHTGLLHKLSLLGLNTSSIDWLNNYLSDRVLHVRVGSALSRTFPLSAGVPQGSHLGPVLFLAFINDLPATIPSSSELYADDALLHQHCSADNSLEGLQQSITSAECWALSWHGQFGHSKTVALPIGACKVSLSGISCQNWRTVDSTKWCSQTSRRLSVRKSQVVPASFISHF